MVRFSVQVDSADGTQPSAVIPTEDVRIVRGQDESQYVRPKVDRVDPGKNRNFELLVELDRCHHRRETSPAWLADLGGDVHDEVEGGELSERLALDGHFDDDAQLIVGLSASGYR